MGNALCLSRQADSGLPVKKNLDAKDGATSSEPASRPSNQPGPSSPRGDETGHIIQADEDSERKPETGDLTQNQGRPTAANSSSLHVLLTTNSLIPPVMVATDSVIFQSPEQMMEDVQLLDAIGAGGFAIVYQGVYQGGDVAVKIAVTSTVDRAGLREALVSPQLRHPHVVQTYFTRGTTLTAEHLEAVYGANAGIPPTYRSSLQATPSEDGLGAPRKITHERQGWREVLLRVGATPNRCLLMMVQELCDVGSLARAIRQGIFRPKPGVRSDLVARRVLLRTAAEVCRGMIHLHSVSVVHGDLKPANVLLARSRADRRGFIAKVADFGLSHLLQGGCSQVESANWGTVSYASPESFNGTHSKSSDVYSFGIVLWEMLTGKRPYEQHTAVQIMMGVSMQGMRPEWPEAEWPALCALGRSCLAQQPGLRPSFRELERQLVCMEEELREESIRRSIEERSRSSEPLPKIPSATASQRTAAGVITTGGCGGGFTCAPTLPGTPKKVREEPEDAVSDCAAAAAEAGVAGARAAGAASASVVSAGEPRPVACGNTRGDGATAAAAGASALYGSSNYCHASHVQGQQVSSPAGGGVGQGPGPGRSGATRGCSQTAPQLDTGCEGADTATLPGSPWNGTWQASASALSTATAKLVAIGEAGGAAAATGGGGAAVAADGSSRSGFVVKLPPMLLARRSSGGPVA